MLVVVFLPAQMMSYRCWSNREDTGPGGRLSGACSVGGRGSGESSIGQMVN